MIRDDNDYLTKAMHAYENRQCISLEEFKEDLYRIVTIKKCITKYQYGEELNIRLILNNFIILFNVFGPKAYDLICYKFDDAHAPVAFAFLAYINRIPPDHEVLLDQFVVQKLKEM